MTQLLRAPLPDDKEVGYLQPWTVQPGPTKHALALHHEVVPFLTHNLKGRTKPCLEPFYECPACKEGHSKRWYGLLPILPEEGGRIRLLMITWEGYRRSQQLKANDGHLTGKMLSVLRDGKVVFAPLHIQVLEPFGPLARIPKLPTIDFEASLAKTWGQKSIEIHHPRLGYDEPYRKAETEAQ